jgi:hypothetical protein
VSFCHVDGIKEGIRRVFTEISGIKDFVDLWDHLLLLSSGRYSKKILLSFGMGVNKNFKDFKEF